jgi:hypothetical protein
MSGKTYEKAKAPGTVVVPGEIPGRYRKKGNMVAKEKNGELTVDVWPHDPRNGQPWRRPDPLGATVSELLRGDDKHMRLFHSWVSLGPLRNQLAADIRWGQEAGRWFRCLLPSLAEGAPPECGQVIIKAPDTLSAAARFKELCGIIHIGPARDGGGRDIIATETDSHHDEPGSPLAEFKQAMGMPLIGE